MLVIIYFITTEIFPTLQSEGARAICVSKFEGFVWEYSEINILIEIVDRMFTYLIEINVNVPPLLCFVVLEAVNGECRRFEGLG